ncbi:FimV/HubP family polar landmark protein [Thioalkalivibrio sp. ALJ24]|uniref:FimV/HubP family polar landmark protein n=1 Tax=Thioalkalivibrio sp. ALJ24 TaxID=545276 RepID=UPI000688E5BF|nr:FimV/HubP family polar landmark protein [Thioalkalivibrio sp. ALJ24]
MVCAFGVAGTAHAGEADAESYTVGSEDTLWSIAERLRPDSGTSVQQMMLALFERNPQAFDGAMDRMRSGATLMVPDAEQVQRHDAKDARDQVEATGPDVRVNGGNDGHRVQGDETLWSIARQLRPSAEVPIDAMAQALFEHNPHAFDGARDRMLAGALLRIPPEYASEERRQADASANVPAEVAQAAQDDDSSVSGEERESPRGFTFGEEQPDADDDADEPSEWDVRLRDVLVEGGVLGTSDRPVHTTQYGRAILTAARPLGEGWELRLGARADLQAQHGREAPNDTRLRADYHENYLRYRGDNTRLTLGTQRILWGQVDEIPPTDRLSTRDLTRFGLDPYAERRRANPAIRAEWFQGPWQADLVWLPVFRPAEMPDRDSLWHPVDRNRGRLLGLPEDPALAPVIREAGLDDDVSGDGGGGVRLSRSGRGADLAVTVQRARHSEPYYRFDDETREALLAGTPPQDPMLESVHPRTWVVGGDVVFVAGAWTWRAEAAWLSDVPVTQSEDLRQTTKEGVDWVVGVEGFPGGGDFRMTTQLAGQHLLDASGVLDVRESYFLTGELEAPFSAHEWRARMRYSLGLNQRDAYLNPEIAWVANEPHELFVGAHWLDGAEDTPGGFYRDNRMLVLGWRGEF